MTPTIDRDDPRLTAYALGELHGDELSEFERLLAESSATRDALAQMQELIASLRQELTAEPALGLTGEQRHQIEARLPERRSRAIIGGTLTRKRNREVNRSSYANLAPDSCDVGRRMTEHKNRFLSLWNWLARLPSAYVERKRRLHNCSPRRRRSWAYNSITPAMIETLEPRRLLSAAPATDLAFGVESTSSGMVTGHITGTVSSASSSGVYTQVEFDLNGDGNADSSESVNADGTFDHAIAASFGTNTVYLRVTEYDGTAMSMTQTGWQEFAFDITPPVNNPPSVSNLVFTVENASNGIVYGRLEGDVIDVDATTSTYEIQIDRNDDGSPDEWDSASGSSPIHFTHANMLAVGGSNTVKVRAIEWDAATMMPLEGDWVALTFNVDLVDEKPTVDQLAFTLGPPGFETPAGRNGTITGVMHDDGVTYDQYIVQVDKNGDGMWDWDATGYPESQFTLAVGGFTVGSHTVRVRAVEVDASFSVVLEGDWVDLTFNITNAAPIFSNTSPSIDVEIFVGDEYPLPTATDPDGDSLGYTLDKVPPGTEFVNTASAHRVRVVDAAAFRAAVVAGGTYTLTATDTFGETGTTQFTFRLAAGSTITVSATTTPILVDNSWWDDGSRTAVTSILGTANVTVSAVTAANPANGGLTFSTIEDPIVDIVWSLGSISDKPVWSILAGLPTVTSQGVTQSADGMNETLTIVVSQVLKVIAANGTTVIARLPYDLVFTLSTDGSVTKQVTLGTQYINPAYSPRDVYFVPRDPDDVRQHGISTLGTMVNIR